MTTHTTQREADERAKVQTLEQAARKLMTYAGIYTGDKQARRLASELLDLAQQAAPEAPIHPALAQLKADCAAATQALKPYEAAPEAPDTEQQTWAADEIADACAKAGLGILECHGLMITLKGTSAATTASASAQPAPLDELFAAIDEAQRMNHYNESSFQLGVRVARLKCLADDLRAALAATEKGPTA